MKKRENLYINCCKNCVNYGKYIVGWNDCKPIKNGYGCEKFIEKKNKGVKK